MTGSRRKRDSARRWKARYLLGKEVPVSVWNDVLVLRVPYSERLHAYSFDRQTTRLLHPAKEASHDR